MNSSKKPIKIAGALTAAALLVVVGVMALNNQTSEPHLMPLEHALARAENVNTPMSDLPEEFTMKTPKGWEIESDEPVAGAPDEELGVNEIDTEPYDEDIDSPVLVEEDEQGDKVIIETKDGVLIDDEAADDDETEDGMAVTEDVPHLRRRVGRRGRRQRRVGFIRRRCPPKFRRCVTKKRCKQACKPKCKRVVRRKCKHRKFCRCYCKFRKNKKAARKCVVYKKKICGPVGTTLCKRKCRKFCARLRRCFCCPKGKSLVRLCTGGCVRMLRRTKCGNCRCRVIRCAKRCKMMCRKK